MKLPRDAIEDVLDVGSHQTQRGDSYDTDERDDKAVFDHCLALFVLTRLKPPGKAH